MAADASKQTAPVAPERNYAFIDSNNLNLGVLELGWSLDFRKFRVYLAEKYGIAKAYLFIGYRPEFQDLYRLMWEFGYELIFKPIIRHGDGEVKGNVDAELVLEAILRREEYGQAVIVSNDGDFYCLVNYLYAVGKLKMVISPNQGRCSALIKRAAREKIVFLDNLSRKLRRE